MALLPPSRRNFYSSQQPGCKITDSNFLQSDCIVADDFYTSNVAWAFTGEIAVALKSDVHLWSSNTGHDQIRGAFQDASTGTVFTLCHITAVSYSADSLWLAVARQDGLIQIFPRSLQAFGSPIRLYFTGDIACLKFRPLVMVSDSVGGSKSTILLIGDHMGTVHAVELILGSGAALVCSPRRFAYSGHSQQIT